MNVVVAGDKSDEIIEMGQTTLDDVHPPKSCCASCCGFIWKDWTQVVGRIGVIGGLGATGVGIGLAVKSVVAGPYVVAAGVASVIIGYLFVDVRLSCVMPEKEFEDNVNLYGKENQQLKVQIGDLSKQLEKMTLNKDELASTLKLAHNEVEDLKGALGTKVQALDEVAKRLQLTEEKLQVVQKLYLQFKEAAERFSSDLKSFNQSNKVFKTNNSKFSTEVDKFDKEKGNFSKEVKEVDDLNDFYIQQNKELKLMMDNLGQNVGSLQERFSEMRHALTELSNETSILDIADDKFSGATHDLETLVPLLNSILKGFKDLIGNVEDVPKVGGEELILILDGENKTKTISMNSKDKDNI